MLEDEMANDVQTNGAVEPSKALATVGSQALSHSNEGTIDAFSSASSFETAQRMAKMLASSSMVPQAFQGNLANCVIAIEMASRIGASVFAVMQNLDIIHGKPSFRATFLIATVNACGRFSPLRFRWIGEKGTDDFGCYAIAKDKDGEECIGAEITIGMAKAEGWYSRNGSKWKTLTNQMLMYRAAAFWQRIYAPELGVGMHSSEESIEAYGYTVEEPKRSTVSSLEAALRAEEPKSGTKLDEPKPTLGEVDKPIVEAKPSAKRETKAKKDAPTPPVDVDPETGEIVPPPGAGDAWEPGQ